MFFLRSFSPEPFGTGIYLLGSMLDHSCVPNCTIGFLGRDLVVTATENIPVGKLSSTAFISYVNTLESTKSRNKKLREQWYFTCECEQCKNVRYVDNYCMKA